MITVYRSELDTAFIFVDSGELDDRRTTEYECRILRTVAYVQWFLSAMSVRGVVTVLDKLPMVGRVKKF